MRMAVPPRREIVPSSVLGMLIFVAAEVMMFTGFISAFTISRAATSAAMWTLPAPVLPAAETAFNTAALLASGVLLYRTQRQMASGDRHAGRTLLWAWGLGTAFVVLQGREWVRLLAAGLTLQSSPLGSFFYVIVGAHAVHAVAALVALGIAWVSLRRGRLSPTYFMGACTFWYFVVGIWPIIYWRVYF